MSEVESHVVVEINRKLTNILTLLQGHELNKGDKGMLGRQDDHEIRIAKIEKKFDRITWTVIGMSIPAGYGVINFLKYVVNQIS